MGHDLEVTGTFAVGVVGSGEFDERDAETPDVGTDVVDGV